MSHFVNDIQGYISNQILRVSWQELVNSLEHNVRMKVFFIFYIFQFTSQALSVTLKID